MKRNGSRPIHTKKSLARTQQVKNAPSGRRATHLTSTSRHPIAQLPMQHNRFMSLVPNSSTGTSPSTLNSGAFRKEYRLGPDNDLLTMKSSPGIYNDPKYSPSNKKTPNMGNLSNIGLGTTAQYLSKVSQPWNTKSKSTEQGFSQSKLHNQDIYDSNDDVESDTFHSSFQQSSNQGPGIGKRSKYPQYSNPESLTANDYIAAINTKRVDQISIRPPKITSNDMVYAQDISPLLSYTSSEEENEWTRSSLSNPLGAPTKRERLQAEGIGSQHYNDNDVRPPLQAIQYDKYGNIVVDHTGHQHGDNHHHHITRKHTSHHPSSSSQNRDAAPSKMHVRVRGDTIAEVDTNNQKDVDAAHGMVPSNQSQTQSFQSGHFNINQQYIDNDHSIVTSQGYDTIENIEAFHKALHAQHHNRELQRHGATAHDQLREAEPYANTRTALKPIPKRQQMKQTSRQINSSNMNRFDQDFENAHEDDSSILHGQDSIDIVNTVLEASSKSRQKKGNSPQKNNIVMPTRFIKQSVANNSARGLASHSNGESPSQSRQNHSKVMPGEEYSFDNDVSLEKHSHSNVNNNSSDEYEWERNNEEYQFDDEHHGHQQRTTQTNSATSNYASNIEESTGIGGSFKYKPDLYDKADKIRLLKAMQNYKFHLRDNLNNNNTIGLENTDPNSLYVGNGRDRAKYDPTIKMRNTVGKTSRDETFAHDNSDFHQDMSRAMNMYGGNHSSRFNTQRKVHDYMTLDDSTNSDDTELEITQKDKISPKKNINSRNMSQTSYDNDNSFKMGEQEQDETEFDMTNDQTRRGYLENVSTSRSRDSIDRIVWEPGEFESFIEREGQISKQASGNDRATQTKFM